jgi:hypothetical protein
MQRSQCLELVTWAGHELRPLAEISSVLAYREMCIYRLIV